MPVSYGIYAYQRHELEYFLQDATPALSLAGRKLRDLADELAVSAGVGNILELDGQRTSGGEQAETFTSPFTARRSRPFFYPPEPPEGATVTARQPMRGPASVLGLSSR